MEKNMFKLDCKTVLKFGLASFAVTSIAACCCKNDESDSSSGPFKYGTKLEEKCFIPQETTLVELPDYEVVPIFINIRADGGFKPGGLDDKVYSNPKKSSTVN